MNSISQPAGEKSMFIAMNRFKVVKGEEAAFEEIWSSRKTRLDEMQACGARHAGQRLQEPVLNPREHDRVHADSNRERQDDDRRQRAR